MRIELNDEQRQAIARGDAVRVAAPEVGGEVVILLSAYFDQLVEDEREQASFRGFALQQAARLARENVNETD